MGHGLGEMTQVEDQSWAPRRRDDGRDDGRVGPAGHEPFVERRTLREDEGSPTPVGTRVAVLGILLGAIGLYVAVAVAIFAAVAHL